MKTLDEVIETAPYIGTEWTNDALYYLKEYRSEKAMWESDRKGYLNWIEQYKEAREKHQQAVIELKKNPPLTWDELKQMRGKPVWIEEIGQKYSSPHWEIHNGIEDAYDGDEILYLQPFFETETKNSLGKTWNAYRKER